LTAQSQLQRRVCRTYDNGIKLTLPCTYLDKKPVLRTYAYPAAQEVNKHSHFADA